MNAATHINLNDRVRVRLTPSGKKRYEAFHGHFLQAVHAPEVLEVQLHELMHVFGPLMRMGAYEAFFEKNEIELIAPKSPVRNVRPFTTEPECVKCTGNRIRSRHCSFRSAIDWLECTCENCGFSWTMETADSQSLK